MASEALSCIELQLTLSEIVLDLGAEVRPHIYVLPLDIACASTREVPTRMLMTLIVILHHLVFSS